LARASCSEALTPDAIGALVASGGTFDEPTADQGAA
jgi:hypothetical protein